MPLGGMPPPPGAPPALHAARAPHQGPPGGPSGGCGGRGPGPPDDHFDQSGAFPITGEDHHDHGRRGGRGGRQRSPPPDDIPIFLEAAVEEFVAVPKALLGKVIGKQAQTIIEIREKSGAFKVDARDQTSDPCQVKIAGTAESVKKARALIMDLIDGTKTKHEGSDYVEIPKSKIGMVIGLKGSQVNDIQNQTGTKIDVDFDSDPCKCFIKGQPDNVQKAKQVLLTIAMQIEDDRSEYLDFPKTASGALIGAQGSRVREFQEQSGARIDVDKTGLRCRVRLTGTPDQVSFAKHLVMQEVEKASMPQLKPPGAMLDAFPLEPMQIPAHQPTTFPATLAESLARAKAAAMAVNSGMVTGAPVAANSFDYLQPPSLGPPSEHYQAW